VALRLPASPVPLDSPFVLGVVNVTPTASATAAASSIRTLPSHTPSACSTRGPDAVDVGGESTRPHNAGPVDAAEEAARVVPVVRELHRRRPEALISVDTVKAAVARAALDAGASIVNDVSAMRLDPGMAATCATAGAGVILMHSRGAVADMATYAHAAYGNDVVGEVSGELAAARDAAVAAGVAPSAIVLDPGIGFAKRSAHSLALLAAIGRIAALGHPVLVGASRKRFIGELTNRPEPADRLHGTLGAHVAALAGGARLFRVHDVRPHREALDVAWAALRGAG
jgi:dihydropteroate synthase